MPDVGPDLPGDPPPAPETPPEAEGVSTPPPEPEEPLAKARAEIAELKEQVEKARAQNSALSAQIEELKPLAAAPPEAPKDLQRIHLLQIQPVRDILVLLLVIGLFRLGYLLRTVTIPMLLALTLAYLVEPLVSRAVRRGYMTRPGAAVIVILAIAMLVVAPTVTAVTIGVNQGVAYAQDIQGDLVRLQNFLRQPKTPESAAELKEAGTTWYWIGDFLKGMQEGAGTAPAMPTTTAAAGAEPAPEVVGPPSPEGAEAPPARVMAAPEPTEEAAKPGGTLSTWVGDLLERNIRNLGRLVSRQLVGPEPAEGAARAGVDAVTVALRIVRWIAYVAFSFFLVMFFFFFFCVGWERVERSVQGMIPKWKKTRTLDMLRQMDAVIAGFVRGRLIIMVILMAVFTVGYWLIGVPAPFLVGPIVGILAIVPYLGLVSIPLSIGLMWLQPVGPAWQQNWWWVVLAPIALYFVIQTIDDYILTPKIQGKATQMDTPTILFAVLAGGTIAGFYGILLAIPVAACVKIVLRESFWPRFRAWAEGRVKDFLPISRYDPTDAVSPGSGG